jgi:putative transposase
LPGRFNEGISLRRLHRGHFPSDEAATKLLFLILNRSEKEWIMPPREWCMAKAQFAVLFGERFTRAMA